MMHSFEDLIARSQHIRPVGALEGHTDRVLSVAFSPDGRWLASGSNDETVRLWEVETGRAVRTLEGHTNWVRSVAFSPDGRWLASGSDDRTVRLWEVETGSELRVLAYQPNDVGWSQNMIDLAWSRVEELSKGELLPPAIYLVGGGAALPDLLQRLETFPWTERLPFARQPIIQTVQPEMLTNIVDPNGHLKDAQDITPMALAYQAVELQNENNVLERALNRVIHNMHN